MTDANNQMTQYTYDAEDNLTSITDANSHATSFAYDAQQHLTKTTFPSAKFESYTYDHAGNLMTKTDRKGQTINYFYDNLARLVSKSYPDSTSVSYSYDDAGRLTQVQDPTGMYSFSLDNMGRLKQTTTAYAFLPGQTFAVAYGYNAASQRTSLTDPNSGLVSYGYDNLDRLTTIADYNSNSFGFGYDALGRRTQLTRPNGVNTNYGYDTVSNLSSVLHQKAAATLDGSAYTYDSVGNRKSKTNRLNSTTANYAYDSIYQLTGVTGPNPESYGFDPVGNRLSSQNLSSYTYNASNELTTTGSASYIYDDNGNLLTKSDSVGTTTYNWDVENRLTSVHLSNGSTVNFKYDPFGRRIEKGSSIYIYDGPNLIEEADTSGNLIARYLFGAGTDEPLAAYRGGVSAVYQADGLGSITSLTTTSGIVSDSFNYDSFGNLLGSAGSFVQPFRYTGREFDGETGLYYYRARYYDSTVGRFLSEDPARFDAGKNFYTYVDNDPTDFIDPTGLRKAQVCCRGLYKMKPLLKPWHHCYIKFINDDGSTDTYGVLGNPGSSKNQIPRHGRNGFEDPREGDKGPIADRDAGGKCTDLPANECQLKKLQDGLQNAVNAGTCPSCGKNYRLFFGFFDGFNSNTWVYNMLEGAGIKPPSEGRAPGYHHAPGAWY